MTASIENLSYTNIEFGAGCGNFGQRFYPNCFTTDVHDGSHCEICYIDFTCDVMQPLSWENRFDIVIMCNPWAYGFKDKDDAYSLLDNLAKILKNGGKIIIIGNDTNQYCKRDFIVKRVGEFNQNQKIQFEYHTTEEFEPTVDYPNYIFYTTGGLVKTVPNHKTELYVLK